MHQGDVYWVDLDQVRGEEIRNRRPVVIVGNNAATCVQNRVQIVPLTGTIAVVHRWEALVHINGVPNKALADQIRTVAKERLTEQIGALSPREMLAVEQALRVQLDLP